MASVHIAPPGQQFGPQAVWGVGQLRVEPPPPEELDVDPEPEADPGEADVDPEPEADPDEAEPDPVVVWLPPDEGTDTPEPLVVCQLPISPA